MGVTDELLQFLIDESKVDPSGHEKHSLISILKRGVGSSQLMHSNPLKKGVSMGQLVMLSNSLDRAMYWLTTSLMVWLPRIQFEA